MSSSNPDIFEMLLFHPKIMEAISKNASLSPRMIKESDKVHLLPAIQTWLLKRLGTFDIRGYSRETVLDGWFDRDAMIEEFDDLYLEFRDFLRVEKGIDPDAEHTLIRFKDNFTFIIVEGKQVEQSPNGFGYTPTKGCEPMEFESDPFL